MIFGFVAAVVALVLTIWFRTNAFFEYLGWLPAPVFRDFAKVVEAEPGALFVDFLAENYSGFFVRLLTCPICLSVVVTVPVFLLFSISTLFFIGQAVFFAGFSLSSQMLVFSAFLKWLAQFPLSVLSALLCHGLLGILFKWS
jgi:hypothetical protein